MLPLSQEIHPFVLVSHCSVHKNITKQVEYAVFLLVPDRLPFLDWTTLKALTAGPNPLDMGREIFGTNEAFCNNENGIMHVDSLRLSMSDRGHTPRNSISLHLFGSTNRRPYCELMMYPFSAVDRYQRGFSLLASRFPAMLPMIEDIRALQEMLSVSRGNALRAVKLISYLRQIKDLPPHIQWIGSSRECLKCGPVKKRKTAWHQEKDRIFYLFSDVLVYTTVGNQYKGMFYTRCLAAKSIPNQHTQFSLFTPLDGSNSAEIKYSITAESGEDREDWLQKLHTA